MKPFCEIIVANILPAIRAVVAKELIEEYGLNQTEVSKKTWHYSACSFSVQK
jgi:hypothetical protein